MRTVPVQLLGTVVDCRGYCCSHQKETDGKDLPDPQFIFYLMATNKCNGLCPFCDVNRKFLNSVEVEPDLTKLRRILTDLYGRNLISKISVTGGDPLLDVDRTNKLLRVVFDVNPEAKVDITTNGSMLANLCRLEHVDKLATIHVSRHHFETWRNNQVFQLRTATQHGLQQYAELYPGKISLNCCLVAGYIDSPELVEKYLDWAGTIKHLKSAGFISLMDKNEFCRKNLVKEEEILRWVDEDPYNYGHNYLYDTDICECRVWYRIPKNYFPLMSFWWKVNRLDIPYCRQLLFTVDNRLTINFNEIGEIPF